MSFILKYVLRHLLRNFRRFKIVMISIVLATGVIVWLLTLNKAGHADLAREITQTYVGKSQLVHKDFYGEENARIFPNKFFFYDKKFDDFSNSVGFVTPRVLFPVFIAGPKQSIGTLLVGIDENLEKKYGRLASAISEGQFVNHSIPNSIVIGKRLLKKLNVKVGDQLVILGQAIDGSMGNELFTISGVLDLGGGDLEERIALSDIESVRSLASLPPNAIHLLTLYNEDHSLEFTKTAKEVLGEKGRLVSWRELLPDLALSIDTMSSLIWLISFVIIFVIGFGVSSTFFISFVEREKEFKALATIGVSYPWIIASLLLEIFILTVFSLVLGNLFALAVNFYFSHFPVPLSIFTGGKAVLLGGLNLDPQIYFRFYPELYLSTSLLMVLSVVLATLYPVLRLLRRSRHVI